MLYMYIHIYILLSKTTFFSPCSAEDQVAEVYKEFKVAVQVDPERMKRRSQASSDNSSIASRELSTVALLGAHAQKGCLVCVSVCL